uniref:mediator of RNA polymerase II transcription subunit 1-like isoform X1 n=1 Tax=Styela clava TaxID=7725 RepID=UPI00193A4842|nr:mediator of RNA polymerase II transcription subunit 1-like isoform X1 [Styela clava]
MEGVTQNNKKKQDSEALMEYLRRNPPRVKSIGEVVNLLHVISTEQRSCNVLRSCVDKVLMNMSNIRTLRDIIERLRSVSRTNGFRFELPASSSPETRCRLVSDMFSVKIILGTSNTPDHSPTVIDVSIQHSDEYRTSPHLINIIRAGKFLELSSHLQGLTEMYLTSGSRPSRTKVYMSLQSLETDLVKMSQIYKDTHKDASALDIVMNGTVGVLTPRLAGDRSHFAFFVSPYDLIDTSAKQKISLNDVVPKHIGLHAEVSIEQRSTACNLPITPLITNKHPIDASGMPRFLDVSHHNSMMLQACFVLHLKPPVPVLSKVVEDIAKITNLGISSEDDHTTKPYLELLNANKKTFKIPLGDEIHVYHLDISELKGSLVNKVYFTHPGHVPAILCCLRKQSHLNTLISSCIRDTKSEIKKYKQWYFEVSCSRNIDKVCVIMEHPSTKSTASLEIKLDKSGFQSCTIFTGRGDPPLCTDEFVAKVLSKCSSLPITMRKLIEQSIKNPKKEAEVNRARPLFAPSTHQPPPTLLTVVKKPPINQQSRSSSSSTPTPTVFPSSGSMTTTPTQFPLPHPVDHHKPATPKKEKVQKNPMLTQLLIPNNQEMMEPAAPMKSHPMLMGLLKDDLEQDQAQTNPQRGGKIPTPQGGYQSNQLTTMLSGGSGQFNPASGFMSPSSTYGGMEPPIPMSGSHTMPPPSYPSSHSQNQMGQLPNMSPVQHSPAAGMQQFQRLSEADEMTGPVTPTLSFGMMSPGLSSPGLPQQGRGRRASRQKSYPIENSDFPVFETSQDSFQAQMNIETDALNELLAMQHRQGMTTLRRTDSMSPGVSLGSHMPLQHSSSLKSISENMGNNNLLTRSSSASSGKGGRSMMSPGPRGLRTPEGMMTLGSPPMFDASGNNQRGSRVKSFDSHQSELFRSPLPSMSPGGLSMNFPLSAGSMQDPEADPFTFDDNKNPSKISMTETTVGGGSTQRSNKPPLYHSTSTDEAMKELAKSKPVLLRALTEDLSFKPETQRPTGSSAQGLMPNLTSLVQSSTSNHSLFDLPNKLMTSTSITTMPDKGLVRQNAVDKPGSTTPGRSGDTKNEKAVRRRNSSKNDEGKAPAKKRGRPPSVKDHGGKKKKGEGGGPQSDDPNANPPIMLNIQLSSTGAPISSTTKTKPLLGSALPQKNQTGINPIPVPATSITSIGTSNNNTTNAPTTTSSTGLSGTPMSILSDIEKYLKSQEELQSRKKKKVIGKTPFQSKQSFGPQSSSSSITSADKNQQGYQLGKHPGSVSPRNGGAGVMAQKRARKNSIEDIVTKLASDKMSTNIPGVSSPSIQDSGKQSFEKDANSNLLTKSKSLLSNSPYQKPPGSIISKLPQGSTEEKNMKSGTIPKPLGHAKSLISKINPNLNTMLKGGFTAKTGRPQVTELPSGMKTQGESDMEKVLKFVNQAAAATAAKGPTMHAPAPLNKVGAPKVPRNPPPAKVRSITPTSVPVGSSPIQRKSPSQMLTKTLSSDLAARQLSAKLSGSNSAGTPPPVKKSPLRNPSIGGLPARPSSASSIDPPSSSFSKSLSTSPTPAAIGLARKSAPGSDQHFVAPSISPNSKRTSSPQIQRTTSPLTRIDDKVGKAIISGRSPHRPSPTHSRISTPIPSGSPQSPDDRLMIIDDAASSTQGSSTLTQIRDEQTPVFISGRSLNERQSPERAAMPTPLSPTPAMQKSSSILQGSKRAPTPRNITLSPSLSPALSSPYIPDDELMNQAVT